MLEARVQIFVDFWEWLKRKDKELWGDEEWEKIVDEKTNEVKESFSQVVDNAADGCKKRIQKLPERQRMKAARFFASLIDLVTKSQATVCKMLTVLKDYIGDSLESAWSILKDIIALIKGTAEEVTNTIRSKLNSRFGPKTDGDFGIPLLPW
ncbi:hypothetical protein BDD12DRAFT_862167 [Trichophaea hybrida]|nr:hypothetical protein BDD12DRAFT_862167 [Trichophaea hybrida]